LATDNSAGISVTTIYIPQIYTLFSFGKAF
jgi:hypothetical protein